LASFKDKRKRVIVLACLIVCMIVQVCGVWKVLKCI